jgi:Tfp pilus assembly protein PilX
MGDRKMVWKGEDCGMRIADFGMNTSAIPPWAFGIPHLRRRRGPRQSGVALLLCIFVLAIITVWLVDMLNSQTVYQSALRNTIEYEQALYLANAGIHHAVAELETSTSWRGTVTAGSYPASGSYSATAVDGATSGTVDVTSTGVAGETTRRLQATVQVQ